MIRWMAALATALVWTALAAVPARAADKVVLMLNWYVYGEHAPFYYGKAKGIYAAENIDLEIQEGRGSAATTQAVRTLAEGAASAFIPQCGLAPGFVSIVAAEVGVSGLSDRKLRSALSLKEATMTSSRRPLLASSSASSSS